MQPLRPNQQRAKIAMILIWIVFALEIISFISGFLQYNLLEEAKNGHYFTNDQLNANDIREGIVGIFYSLAMIISMITFIKWFRRAYFNLHLRTNYLSFSEGWAAGSWFVPIIYLFRPFQIMKELYNRTKELLLERGIMGNFGTAHLGWWWTFWIISNILGQIFFRMSFHNDDIDSLLKSTFVGMANNIIGIPLGLITIKVIKNYADMESLLFELKEEEPIVITAPDGDDLQSEG